MISKSWITFIFISSFPKTDEVSIPAKEWTTSQKSKRKLKTLWDGSTRITWSRRPSTTPSSGSTPFTASTTSTIPQIPPSRTFHNPMQSVKLLRWRWTQPSMFWSFSQVGCLLNFPWILMNWHLQDDLDIFHVTSYPVTSENSPSARMVFSSMMNEIPNGPVAPTSSSITNMSFCIHSSHSQKLDAFPPIWSSTLDLESLIVLRPFIELVSFIDLSHPTPSHIRFHWRWICWVLEWSSRTCRSAIHIHLQMGEFPSFVFVRSWFWFSGLVSLFPSMAAFDIPPFEPISNVNKDPPMITSLWFTSLQKWLVESESLIYHLLHLPSSPCYRLPWRSYRNPDEIMEKKSGFKDCQEYKRLPRELRKLYRDLGLMPLEWIDPAMVVDAFKAAITRRDPNKSYELPKFLIMPSAN